MKSLRLPYLLTLLGALSGAIHVQPLSQVPVGLDEPDAYYIGMDLSVSHGAVAVAFSNGTTMPIARVEGSKEYKTLLAQLARQNRWEPDPPWVPVDPDQTAIFSKMITDLKVQAEEHLGIKVNSTLVAAPALPYLYDENLRASVKDAGLEDMDKRRGGWLGASFRQPQGAMAGLGIGMCHTYWDQHTCSHEAAQMSRDCSVTVLYTSNALCVLMGISKGMYGYQRSNTIPSSMDFTLGYDERNHNPDESFYWSAVRERIMTGALGGAAFLPWNVTVMVYGDKNAVDDPKFREVLQDAIHDLPFGRPPIYFPDDPEFLVARGTAAIVRRGAWLG